MLGAADEPPTWADLQAEGEDDLIGQVAALDIAFLRDAAEMLVVSWTNMDPSDRCSLAEVLGRRLVEITDPLSFASVADTVVAASMVCHCDAPGRFTAASLATALEQALDGSDADAVRARPALGGLCDLVASGHAQPYRLLAAMERLSHHLPESLASPAARAAGRMAELRDDSLFQDLLDTAMHHPGAVGDASVEAGHITLRRAFTSPDADTAMTALRDARLLYVDAQAADPDRPDVQAFIAAIDLLMAYNAGAHVAVLDEPARRMHRAVSELARYDMHGDTPSRPLGAAGDWWAFTAQLRGAAETLAGRHNLDLRRGLLALLDVYAGARIRVLAEGEPGMQTILRPPIDRWVADNLLARSALVSLIEELPGDSAACQAAKKILAVTEGDPGKASRFRSGPDCWEAGRWALADVRPGGSATGSGASRNSAC